MTYDILSVISMSPGLPGSAKWTVCSLDGPDGCSDEAKNSRPDVHNGNYFS